MKKLSYFTVLIPLLFTVLECKAQTGAATKTSTHKAYFDLVRRRYTGEQAYETTAHVEQYFRIAGNTGFNKSIEYVVALLEKAGYVPEEKATPLNRLTYRIEKRAMKSKTWEPVDAALYLEGETDPLLSLSTNRNMIAINSFATPEKGIDAEVVYLPGIEALEKEDVHGKIVFSDAIGAYALFNKAVKEKGAVGMLVYRMPAYTQPEKNVNSIQFGSIPQEEGVGSFALFLSFQAKETLKEALAAGEKTVKVQIATRLYESEELTLVAEIKGSQNPEERFVFSAHVQEPGANDNASGVGCLAEIATVAAGLLKAEAVDPKRTITFLWGDEIISTRRFIQEDSVRAEGIRWGLSLDMVGENTAKTGGSFLIEKMPDPSAIWTRGNDKHSEWGGEVLDEAAMFPHFYNDFAIRRFKDQGEHANWAVNTNPFEGGSDHTPFLDAKIPGLLAWHFTDMFYHTDGDRLENVSKETLRNVGTSALVIALTLNSAGEQTATTILQETESAARQRLAEEMTLSTVQVKNGGSLKEELRILKTWARWYDGALRSTLEIPVGGASPKLEALVEASSARIASLADYYLVELKKL